MEKPAIPLAPRPAARLVIHAEGKSTAGGRRLAILMRRLRALCSIGLRETREPLRLDIDDLQGCRLLALEEAGPRVEVALPAGTYRIFAQRGDVRRSYTMTLAQGASSDLYLRFPQVGNDKAPAPRSAAGAPNHTSSGDKT